MKGLIAAIVGFATLMVATPATAQLAGRFAVEPYVGYGFFGNLPDTDAKLEADVTVGLRALYRLTPQWGVYGNYQRSTPSLTEDDTDLDLGTVDVDHWSVGAEFSYAPRGGAEGMLPILIEAGLGQARYEDGPSDFAVNLGIASAFQFTDRIAVRYGANDYISNYADDRGVVNQFFVHVGMEVTF